uniref:Pentatricopeptide repeat-containing protein n=1 Tax=Rhizophora mucronata TaxID=61149 RepID=A0A2P2NIU4_RHIMU
MRSIFSTILKGRQSLTANAILQRTYSKEARTAPKNLYSRISPLGDPSISVVPVLDQWAEELKEFKADEVRRTVKILRSNRRHKQALEASEWMSSKGPATFSLADRAVQLDLIGRVRGLDSAESYFKYIDDKDKIDKIYGALLNCYVREGLVDKSLSLMQKMKELGFAHSTLPYNNLMSLYARTGQFEKVPDVFSEMKKNGISLDNFSYRICMDSYGARSDLDNVEKILQEMENQPHISMDWQMYAAAAHIHIKAGAEERALIHLKKCEEKVDKDVLGYNYLISLHASLGNKDEMLRLWNLAKTKCKKHVNRDYITMLGCLVKLGEFQEAEKLLDEWDSSCQYYDFRVPNVLLIGYCQKGLIEKAEGMLRCMIEKQKTPTPNSWAILASGYVDRQNVNKAFECMKEALAVQKENMGWRPKPQLISTILDWVGNNGDVEEVESFVSSLESKVPNNRQMYHALIKAYIRGGKEVHGVLESMKNDKIDEDEETKAILSGKRLEC